MTQVFRLCFLCFVISYSVVGHAESFDITYIPGGTEYLIDVDKSYDVVTVNTTGHVHNYGDIGDIFVNSGYVLSLQNTGNVYGTITLAPGAQLVQIVRSGADATLLNVNSGYDVSVVNAADVSLNALLAATTSCNSLTIENSTIILDVSSVRPLTLGDNVVFNIVFPDDADSLIIENVTLGGLDVYFDDSGNDSLYYVSHAFDAMTNTITATRVRNYNYSEILDIPGLDSVLDGNLLSHMNGVTSNAELQKILSESVHFNPIKLMEPVHTFHLFEMFDDVAHFGSDVAGGGVDYVFGRGTSIPVARILGNFGLGESVNVGVSGYVGKIDVSDDYNDFSGLMYGGNIRADYNCGRVVGNVLFGITHEDFDSGFVIDGNKITYNPYGNSEYFTAAIGMRTFNDAELDIVPHVGVIQEYNKLLSDSESYFHARFGADMNVAFNEFAVKYNGVVTLDCTDDGMFYAAMGAGIRLPDDGVVVGVKVGTIYDDSFNLKLSARVAIEF